MIKKVGILTFHASHNYGSMLQAYALQIVLKQYGVDAEEINLRIPAQKKMYTNPLRHLGPRSIWARAKNPCVEFGRIIKWYRFEHFLKKYISLTSQEFHSWSEISSQVQDLGYDAIICGGDQIWNTSCRDFDESYLLPSDIKGIKKLSYSPSLGGILSRVDFQALEKTLKDFDSISTREKKSADILSAKLNKHIPFVADPVLLPGRKFWDQLANTRQIRKKPYLFCYSPFIPKEQDGIVHTLAEQLRLPVVMPLSAGPREFLSLVKNARLVVGNSFHLIVFAAIFHVDFLAINPRNDDRINEFLKILKLEDRSIDSANSIPPSFKAIDWPQVDLFISKYVHDSRSFLKQMLEID